MTASLTQTAYQRGTYFMIDGWLSDINIKRSGAGPTDEGSRRDIGAIPLNCPYVSAKVIAITPDYLLRFP